MLIEIAGGFFLASVVETPHRFGLAVQRTVGRSALFVTLPGGAFANRSEVDNVTHAAVSIRSDSQVTDYLRELR
jgi:hypothetical protein